MEQIIVKTLWVVFIAACWLNLGGVSVLASTKDREEERWTPGGVIYFTLITMFAVVMVYFGVTVHWYRTW